MSDRELLASYCWMKFTSIGIDSHLIRKAIQGMSYCCTGLIRSNIWQFIENDIFSSLIHEVRDKSIPGGSVFIFVDESLDTFKITVYYSDSIHRLQNKYQ